MKPATYSRIAPNIEQQEGCAVCGAAVAQLLQQRSRDEAESILRGIEAVIIDKIPKQSGSRVAGIDLCFSFFSHVARGHSHLVHQSAPCGNTTRQQERLRSTFKIPIITGFTVSGESLVSECSVCIL